MPTDLLKRDLAGALEDALARTTPTGTKPGRYKVVDDALLALLQDL